MAAIGDYEIDIEPRSTGAPKFQVLVSFGGKLVGVDYAVSERQADQVADKMIQRHRELVKETRRWVF